MQKKCQFILAILVTICLWGTVFASTVLSQNYQRPHVVLLASDVLPKSLLSGPNYRVKEVVINDGMINTYELETNFGPLKLESTALLFKRINELRAISKIEELKGTDIYLNAAKGAAMGPVKTATGLVTDPVGTATGIVSGIGNFFGKVTDAATSSDPYKDKALNAITGQSAYKREFAHRFRVDPYTSFEPLQKALNDLAWTSAAGGLTVKAAMMAIPGGAGAAVGYSGTAETMRDLVRDKTPPELEKMNRESLRGMGVDEGLGNVFLSSTSYTPLEKTFLVGALAAMTGVSDRRIFVKLAAMDCEEPVALFLRLRTQLMGLYAEKTKSVASFVDVNGFPFLMSKSGAVVGIFPIDHLAWTPGFAQREMAISSAIQKIQGVTGKELLITGTVEPVARKALEDRGWTVRDKFEDQILLKMGY